jgi:ABC-type multidrug transport system fused ATPase/permease subunit
MGSPISSCSGDVTARGFRSWTLPRAGAGFSLGGSSTPSAWAAGEDFCRALERRLQDLVGRREARALIDQAVSASGWLPIARLDRSARLVAALTRGGGIRRGNEACKVLRTFLDLSPGAEVSLPESLLSVRPAPASDGQEMVSFRGAVLISIQGRRTRASAAPGDWPRSPDDPQAAAGAADRAAAPRVLGPGDEPIDPGTGDGPSGAISDFAAATDVPGGMTPTELSPELTAALAEPKARPNRLFLQFLAEKSVLSLVVLGLGLIVASAGSFVEEVLLPGLIAVRRELGPVGQRMLAAGAVLAFAGLSLCIELKIKGALIRLGRRLEVRFRAAFLDKIPRLNDRYFGSRTLADMAYRGHAIHEVRGLPFLAGRFLGAAVGLVITAGALAWVDPASAPLTLLAAGLALALPLAFNALLAELDYRVRTYDGALLGFYFEALRGLVVVRAHGTERVMRREHEGLLVEWARASRSLVRRGMVLQGLQGVVGFGLAAGLLLHHAGHTADAGGMLLLAYWALKLPDLGREIAAAAEQYPMNRSLLLRLIEPLGAPDDRPREAAGTGRVGGPPDLVDRPGVAVTFEEVTVRASGNAILEGISAAVSAGSHVMIVGPSGAGKSSLVGLLLGRHRPAAGRVLVDGEPLDVARTEQLRSETAWVDPAVQIWNRPLLQNLLYGVHPGQGAEPPVGTVLSESDLYEVLSRLPEGLQTRLGEAGGLLSGGEGQRVRLGRALSRARARLVILDEPFRGLDRETRRELLGRARRFWRGATLHCLSHDVAESLDFERVLVIEGGRVTEDGPPTLLAADPDSHFRALLDAEDALRREIWASPRWRRLRMNAGYLTETRPGSD